jgi:REP element-mobilizing transposase RayT
MSNAYHFVARANVTLFPLTDRDGCADLWQRLRKRFPEIAACVLMPNHLHLLAFTEAPESAVWGLGVDLRAWTRRFHPKTKVWSPIPRAIKIPDHHHLKRQIRYVHLNPCRARLVKDPLEWEWSTHRDLTGCVIDPWPRHAKLAAVFGTSLSKLGESAHRYISADPTVAVGGTPIVRASKPGEIMSANIEVILSAASSATRKKIKFRRGILRDLTVHTTDHLGLIESPDKLGLSLKGWKHILTRPVPAQSLRAILTIMNDPRCKPN